MKYAALAILGSISITAIMGALACSGEASATTTPSEWVAASRLTSAPPPAPASSPIDPRATSAIAQMAAAMAQAKTITFKAHSTTEDVSSTLQKLQFDTSLRGAVKRPDKVFIEKTGSENVTLWFDGTTATILDRNTNTYLRIPVSGGFDGLMVELAKVHVEAPFGGLLRSDIDKVGEHVQTGEYYGPVAVDEVSAHHLAFRQDNVDWQLWIDVQTGLPKKVVITSKMLAAAPEHDLFIRELKVNEPVDDGVFTASLPPGSQQAQGGK